MKRKDLMLALLVVIVWGANFTIIKLGLNGMPSMLLVALRYLFTAIPAIFFIKPPKIELRYIIMYGFTIGVGQFGTLFYAMEIGMPASLASIILQVQAFITPLFGLMLLKERLKVKQIIGFVIAAIGLFFIGRASGTKGITTIPINALVLTIFAAVLWALSNIIAKFASKKATSKGEKLDMLSLVVWSSLIPPIPLLALALVFDTPQTLINSITNLNVLSMFAVLYLAFGATLFGYGVWNNLIVKYPLGKIAPLSLLVPITGLLTARIVLSEQLTRMQWWGVTVILVGLLITNLDIKQISKNLMDKLHMVLKEEE